MPRHATLSKTKMADKLATVFQVNGFEGASLKLLAEATGLSKASLYHHFPEGKAEMASHVLARSGARLQQNVLAMFDGSGSSSGAERIVKSLEGAARYYDGDVPICLMNSLLLGDGRRLFGDRIGVAVDAWQKGLAQCLEEEGVPPSEAAGWAEDAIELIQGALILCRVRGSRDPLERCLKALGDEVLEWTGGA